MSKIYGYSKICLYCNRPFEAKNKNAKFCSDGHRVTFWKIKNGIPLPDYTIKQIRNRIPSKLEKEVAEQTRILQNIDEEIQRNKEKVSELNNQYQMIPGAINKFNQGKFPSSKKRILKEIIRGNKFLEKPLNPLVSHRLHENIDEPKVLLTLNELLSSVEEQIQKLNENNNQLIEKSDNTINLINQLRRGYNIESLKESGKITSAQDLLNIKVDLYKFDNNFNAVFGTPAKSFTAMIHGESGSGKSSFCIQFSDYFSKNHGETIYLSIEEGTNTTFRMKLKENTNGELLFKVGTEREPAKIRELSKTFKLIIIDSLSYANYGAEDVEEIIKFGSATETSFLFLMHETKSGTYKGDTYFEHLTDIFLYAKDGIVTATKNRYTRPNKLSEYKVFKDFK
jgi:hypothetical protein